jgi:hypothetical protein
MSATELPNSARLSFQLSVTGGKMRNISRTSFICKQVIHAELAALRAFQPLIYFDIFVNCNWVVTWWQ